MSIPAGLLCLLVTMSGCDSAGSELLASSDHGSLTDSEFSLAVSTARSTQARVSGTFVGATAYATEGRIRDSFEDECPDIRLLHLRLVWRDDANFVHGGVPGAPPDGPRKAQFVTVVEATGRVCSQSAGYSHVGAAPREVLLYGRRP